MVMSELEPRRYAAPALEKGLDILELLTEQTDGLAQSEVARRLGRTPSEIFRMLNCLERRGFLHRSPIDDLYRLTARMFELSHRHPPTKRLLDSALPVMRRLTADIKQSCHLVVPHDTDALVVAQVDGPGFIGFAVRVGSRAALNDSCSGKVLLAHLDDERREMLLARVGLAVGRPGREELLADLAGIRERGFELRESSMTSGIVDVGAPVLDHRADALASLTIPCIRKVGDTTSVEETSERVRTAAAEVTALLGGTTTP